MHTYCPSPLCFFQALKTIFETEFLFQKTLLFRYNFKPMNGLKIEIAFFEKRLVVVPLGNFKVVCVGENVHQYSKDTFDLSRFSYISIKPNYDTKFLRCAQ